MTEKGRLSSTNALEQGILSDSSRHLSLMNRLKDLSQFDGVIPLTRSAKFFSTRDNIVGLHHFAYLDLTEFTTMTNVKNIKSEAGLKSIWPGKGHTWLESLQLIGFSKKAVERMMQTSVTYNNVLWIWTPALREETDMPESDIAIVDKIKRLCTGVVDAFKDLRRFHMAVQKEGGDHWKSTRQRLLLPSNPSNVVDLVSPTAPKQVSLLGSNDTLGSSCSSSAIDSQFMNSEIVPLLLDLPMENYSKKNQEMLDELSRIQNILDFTRKHIESSCLDVGEVVSRGVLFPEEKEKLSLLLSSVKVTDIVEGLQSINLGNDTYFCLSRFRGTGKKTGQRQARILSHLLQEIGITQHGLSLFLRRHATKIKEALPSAQIDVGPARLTAEETAQIQAGMSKSNYPTLAAQLNSKGHRIFASWNQVQQVKEDNMNDRVFVLETVGVTGNKGKEEDCKMIIISQDVLALLSSELEVRLKNGDLISDFRLRDSPMVADVHDLPIALSQDSGQGSVKAFIHLVGVRGSCSAFKSRIPWMYDQASPIQKKSQMMLP